MNFFRTGQKGGRLVENENLGGCWEVCCSNMKLLRDMAGDGRRLFCYIANTSRIGYMYSGQPDETFGNTFGKTELRSFGLAIVRH